MFKTLEAAYFLDFALMPALKQVSVTETAAKKVKEFMKKEGKDNAVLRLYVTGGGCSGLTNGLAFEDSPGEEDIVVEENGIKVIVDSFSMNYVKGATIDYVDSLEGSGFKIKNPNETSSCSCGHSYNT